jgi:hypothetical protein
VTDTGSHMCVGPSCWTCGEPSELRELRQQQIMPALYELRKERPGADHHALAKAAAQAIRPDIIRALTDRGLLIEALRSLDMTHKALNGSHDIDGPDHTCAGCALVAQIRDHLTRPR